MVYEALETIVMKRQDGTLQKAQPGQRFKIRNPAMADRLIAEGKIKMVEKYITVWKNHAPHGQGRQESLRACMEATFETICLPLYWPPGFRMTDDIEGDEKFVENIKQQVLEGKSTLAEYRRACEHLKRTIETSTRVSTEIDNEQKALDMEII